jgi:hypothetical protein
LLYLRDFFFCFKPECLNFQFRLSFFFMHLLLETILF